MEILTRGLVSLLEAVAQEAAQDGSLADARRAEHHDAPAVLALGDMRLVRQRLETCVTVQDKRGELVQRGRFIQTGRTHHPRLLFLLLQLRRGQFEDS